MCGWYVRGFVSTMVLIALVVAALQYCLFGVSIRLCPWLGLLQRSTASGADLKERQRTNPPPSKKKLFDFGAKFCTAALKSRAMWFYLREWRYHHVRKELLDLTWCTGNIRRGETKKTKRKERKVKMMTKKKKRKDGKQERAEDEESSSRGRSAGRKKEKMSRKEDEEKNI
jgi:hypothetical protein